MKSSLSRCGWGTKLAVAFASAMIAAPLGAAAIAPTPATPAYAAEAQGQWMESNGRKWYRYSDGTYPTNCWKQLTGDVEEIGPYTDWYHFDSDGWVQTGWLKDGDSWYYLSPEGRMVADHSYEVDGKPTISSPMAGWPRTRHWPTRRAVFEPGETLYFCEYYGMDGTRPEGWANIPQFTLHRVLSDVPRPFSSKPSWGTSSVPGGWIYQTDYGTMAWYWQQIDGVWYYFQPYNYLGQRVDNPSFNPEESRPAYFLMATGWCKPVGESSWYYLGTSGAMQTGWLNDGGTWYWLTESGAMGTDWQNIGGTWYYFAASGAMQTGWINLGGIWYRLSESGAMATGWQLINGYWYWFSASGTMATGWQQIGGSWYCFADSGVMLHDCWVGRYYLGFSGAMMVDAWTPDGYYVGPDGAWTPGIG